MPKLVRKPPSPSDYQDPRSLEYFFADLYELLNKAGARTYDLPSISAGNTATFTITVKGAVPGQAQQVAYGLPDSWDTSLQVTAWVSAADTVTLSVLNPTGGSIDMAEATYSARVFP